MTRALVLCAALAAYLLAMAGVAYAATIYGTTENDWGPTSEHPEWPLPDDCGVGGGQGNILSGTLNADDISGRTGCDFVRARDGADTVHGNAAMDTLYGGYGNDRLIGDNWHDHLFGEEGSDYLNTKDGFDENMHFEETRGGPGWDQCFLNSDPDGVYFSECEQLNGSSNPWGQKFVNTSDGGNAVDERGAVNNYLNNHGG